MSAEDTLRAAAFGAPAGDAGNTGLGWHNQDEQAATAAAEGMSSFDLLAHVVNSKAASAPDEFIQDQAALGEFEDALRQWFQDHKMIEASQLLRFSAARIIRLLDVTPMSGATVLPLEAEGLLRGHLEEMFAGHKRTVPPRARASAADAAPPGMGQAAFGGALPEVNQSVFGGLGSMFGTGPGTQSLEALQCVLALAGGKQDELSDIMEKMNTAKTNEAIQKLISESGYGNPIYPMPPHKWIQCCEAAWKAYLWCPPYLENHPGLEVGKKWTPGRVIPEWLEQWSRFSAAALWYNLTSAMDLLNHARNVCRIAADRSYRSVEEAERVAMSYDHTVRAKVWHKYRQDSKTDVAKFFAGEVEGLVSEAERSARANFIGTSSRPLASSGSAGEQFCLKFGMGHYCEGPPRCKLLHRCPYYSTCRSSGGCLVGHVKNLGYTIFKGKGKGKDGKDHNSSSSWDRPRWSYKSDYQQERDGGRDRNRGRDGMDSSDRAKVKEERDRSRSPR